MNMTMKELEDKSISECIYLLADTIQEKNTSSGMTMSHKTVEDLVIFLRYIAEYIKED